MRNDPGRKNDDSSTNDGAPRCQFHADSQQPHLHPSQSPSDITPPVTLSQPTSPRIRLGQRGLKASVHWGLVQSFEHGGSLE